MQHLYSIYLIENTISGKVYIGQTMRSVERRWAQHKHNLVKGRHNNPHLQAAWNKYGEAAFERCVIETHTTLESMNEAEKSLIEYFRYIGVELYNSKQGGDNGRHSEESKQKRRGRIVPEEELARRRGQKRSIEARRNMTAAQERRSGKVFKICSPEGIIFETNNLQGFCRENGLDAPLLWYVIQGKRTHHKGWTRYQSDADARRQATEAAQRQQAPRSYMVRSPEGKVYTTANMKAFCKEHGLNPSHMSDVVQGKRKSHQGWTLCEPE